MRLLARNPMPPSGRLGPAQQRDRESLRRLAQQYADGLELDVANCSRAQAYAFCVARLWPEKWGLAHGLGAKPTAENLEPAAVPFPAGGEREPGASEPGAGGRDWTEEPRGR